MAMQRTLASVSTLPPGTAAPRSADADEKRTRTVLEAAFGAVPDPVTPTNARSDRRADDLAEGEGRASGSPFVHTHLGRAIELHAAGGNAPPEWVHIVPAGEFTGTDGRGPYRLVDPAAVIAASLADGPIVVDENHATDLARGRAARAQGWIAAMEARADGIWGRVEWTATGRDLIVSQSYRALSPAIQSDGENPAIVRRIARVGLVNDPNLPLARFDASGPASTGSQHG